MTEENNEFQDYLRLKRGMLKRCLAIVEDPSSKASALAVAMRFLSECEVAKQPPPTVPTNELPFQPSGQEPSQQQQPATPRPDLGELPFPPQVQPGDERWAPLNQQ